jgi:hypothetical protein
MARKNMNSIAATIKELELSLLKPEVRSSKEALDKLLAEDFIEIGTSGATYTKQDILERLPNNTDSVDYTVTDFTVEIPDENTAITTFKTIRVTNDTDIIISQRSSHWRNTDGHWKIFSHNAIKIG